MSCGARCNGRISITCIDGVDCPLPPDSTARISSGGTPKPDSAWGHEVILRDFVEAAQSDRDPMVTGESARTATELVLRIYETAA